MNLHTYAMVENRVVTNTFVAEPQSGLNALVKADRWPGAVDVTGMIVGIGWIQNPDGSFSPPPVGPGSGVPTLEEVKEKGLGEIAAARHIALFELIKVTSSDDMFSAIISEVAKPFKPNVLTLDSNYYKAQSDIKAATTPQQVEAVVADFKSFVGLPAAPPEPAARVAAPPLPPLDIS